MSKSFSRFQPPQNRSFSLRLFNAHETEINEHFWSFKVISERAAFEARRAQSANSNHSTAALFHASGPDSLRVPPTVTDWLNARDQLENWLRISALVSATSFLEVYFRQVVRSALMSDPLARYHASRMVDGITLVKSGIELPFDEEIKALTRGDWGARVGAYRQIFGSVPDRLTSSVSTLEKIRRLRNEFAHGFGASVDPLPPTAQSTDKRNRLSQQTFIKYVGVISKVASAVDSDLLLRFIGSFELLYYYHIWKNQPIDARDKNYDYARRFKRSVIRDARCEVGPKYCADLISYYDAA